MNIKQLELDLIRGDKDIQDKQTKSFRYLSFLLLGFPYFISFCLFLYFVPLLLIVLGRVFPINLSLSWQFILVCGGGYIALLLFRKQTQLDGKVKVFWRRKLSDWLKPEDIVGKIVIQYHKEWYSKGKFLFEYKNHPREIIDFESIESTKLLYHGFMNENLKEYQQEGVLNIQNLLYSGMWFYELKLKDGTQKKIQFLVRTKEEYQWIVDNIFPRFSIGLKIETQNLAQE